MTYRKWTPRLLTQPACGALRGKLGEKSSSSPLAPAPTCHCSPCWAPAPTSAAGILSAGGSEALGMSVGESSQLQIRTDDERAGTSKSPVLAEKKRDPK